jgi:hypothetical protein
LSLEKDVALHLNKFESLLPRMICAKSDKESLQTDRRTTNRRLGILPQGP